MTKSGVRGVKGDGESDSTSSVWIASVNKGDNEIFAFLVDIDMTDNGSYFKLLRGATSYLGQVSFGV
jgi:hypothetical protein